MQPHALGLVGSRGKTHASGHLDPFPNLTFSPVVTFVRLGKGDLPLYLASRPATLPTRATPVLAKHAHNQAREREGVLSSLALSKGRAYSMANQYRPNIPLREWRNSHGKTQAAIAEQIGVPVRTYMRWENGRSKPRPYACHKLATLAGLPLHVLMAAYEPLPVPEAEGEQNGSHLQPDEEHNRDQAEAHAAAPIKGLDARPPLDEPSAHAAPTHPRVSPLIVALLVLTNLVLVSLLGIVLAAEHAPAQLLPWLLLLVACLALCSQWAIWWLSHHKRKRD